jgi:Putative auto-transporter adhesin, head GIN domain
MRRIFFLASLLVLALAISACDFDWDDDDFGPCISGDGPVVSREFDLANFDAVNLSSSINVNITQGATQKVVVEGPLNHINVMNRNVSNRTWDVDFTRCVRNANNVRVFITIPDVRSLRISGSGDLVSENILKISEIDLSISGSGRMDVGVDATNVISRISGSGNLLLEGKANNLEHTSSGSGDFRAFPFNTKRCDVRISGSGDVELTVSDDASVRISGSGDFRYRGNPRISSNITGSGRIIESN